MNQQSINFESFQTRILSYIEKAKISNEKIDIQLIKFIARMTFIPFLIVVSITERILAKF